MFEKNTIDKKLILYVSLSIIFILFTNNYSSNSIFSEGSAARSGEYYFSIAENSPLFSNEINHHHAQRFIFPFLIGYLANSFGIDLILIFKFFTYINFLIIFLLNLYLCKYLLLNFKNQLLIFGLIIFNPYIFRYFTLYPSMVVDLFFILSIYIFLVFLINNNKLLLYTSIFFALSSRQTGIFLLMGIIFFFILLFFFKKKNVFNLKDLVIISTISILIYFSIDWYLIGSGFTEFPSSAYLGLFHYLRFQFDLKELLLFLFIPLLSLIPIILIIYDEKLIKFEFNLFLKLFLPIIISMLIILQPILGGPTWTGKNIIRLATLSYPFLIYLCLNIITYKKKIENYKIFFIVIFLTVWSLHPTFSKIDIFKFISLKKFIVYKT